MEILLFFFSSFAQPLLLLRNVLPGQELSYEHTERQWQRQESAAPLNTLWWSPDAWKWEGGESISKSQDEHHNGSNGIQSDPIWRSPWRCRSVCSYPYVSWSHYFAHIFSFLKLLQILASTMSTDMGNVSHKVPSIHPVYSIGSGINHTREFTKLSGKILLIC